MKHLLVLFSYFFLSSFFLADLISAPTPQQPTPVEILKKADDAKSPDGDFSFNVKIDDYEKQKKVRTQVFKVYSKGEIFALIDTVSPERLRGRKVLLRDNDLWLYLPSLKKPTRIGMQQRLTGEVANGDVARTRFFIDYNPTIEKIENYKGVPHYVLNLDGKTKEVTYKKIQLWVDKKNFRPSKAIFYALSGKLLKTCVYGGF
jgi:outer membrane lipoprotein-sorting protein